MSTAKPVIDFLSAPLEAGWTIEILADQLLAAIANRSSEKAEILSIKLEDLKDQQSRRLIRPLLAHLAIKAAESENVMPNIYEGKLAFIRFNPELQRKCRIDINFENKADIVQVKFECHTLPTEVPALIS